MLVNIAVKKQCKLSLRSFITGLFTYKGGNLSYNMHTIVALYSYNLLKILIQGLYFFFHSVLKNVNYGLTCTHTQMMSQVQTCIHTRGRMSVKQQQNL